MTLSSPRPLRKPAGQGSSASMAATEAKPINSGYPHDTFKATDTPVVCKDIKGPGAGTSGVSGTVRKIPPRC